MSMSRKKADASAPGVVPVPEVWPSAAKPTPNLVPRYVREDRALAQTKRVLVAAVAAVVLLTAGGVAVTGYAAKSAQEAEASAVLDRDTARASVDNLSSVAAYYDGLESRRKTVTDLLVTDVRHAEMLQALRAAMPAGVSLDAYTTALGAPCPSPNPYEASTAVGCLSVTGTTVRAAALSILLSNLTGDRSDGLFSDPFVTSMSEGGAGEPALFGLNVNFTAEAFSLRYVPKDERPGAAERAAAAVFAVPTPGVTP